MLSVCTAFESRQGFSLLTDSSWQGLAFFADSFWQDLRFFSDSSSSLSCTLTALCRTRPLERRRDCFPDSRETGMPCSNFFFDSVCFLRTLLNRHQLDFPLFPLLLFGSFAGCCVWPFAERPSLFFWRLVSFDELERGMQRATTDHGYILLGA